jgi:hypothetical protein
MGAGDPGALDLIAPEPPVVATRYRPGGCDPLSPESPKWDTLRQSAVPKYSKGCEGAREREYPVFFS